MPFSTMPRLGFVGAGRLARCLAAVWSRAGYPVTAIASRSAASAYEFAGELPACLVADDASAVAQHADIVFLTVPDDAIGATANALRLDHAHGGAKAVVHCSGATPVDVLAAVQAQRADIGGFHPLFLFGGLPSDQTRIAGCSVTIEASGSLHDTLTALVQALGCHPLSIPPGGRLLYHAAAHYAASFALCSLSETVTLWKELGFAEDDALRAILPMLAGTIETAREKGLPGALAGPVSRGDAGIVIKQLALLQDLGGDHAALYALLSRRAVALAKRRASPPPAEALDAMSHAIELVLHGTGPSEDRLPRSDTHSRPYGGTRAPANAKRHKAPSSHAIVMPGAPVWQSRRGVRPPRRAGRKRATSEQKASNERFNPRFGAWFRTRTVR